jgi:hypothetical protein
MSNLIEGLVVAVHLASMHVPAIDGQNNLNLGLQVRTAEGFTFGVYRNTLRRASFYAGWTVEAGPFALALGGVTGYQKRRESVDCAKTEEHKVGFVDCYWDVGVTSSPVLPLISPSVRLPALGGVSPRVSVIPGFGHGNSTVLHLSIEREF